MQNSTFCSIEPLSAFFKGSRKFFQLFFDNNHGILIKVTLQKKLQEIEEKKRKMHGEDIY